MILLEIMTVSAYGFLFFMNFSKVFLLAKFTMGLSLGLCTVIANVAILEILPIRLHKTGSAFFQCNIIFAFVMNQISVPILTLVGFTNGNLFRI